MIALIQVDDDHARIFLEKLLRFGSGAVALRAETQLVARAIPDERGNRTVLRREERQSRAIKSNQAPSRAIKRQQAPYRTPNQCSTMTSVSRFSYTRMSACQIRESEVRSQSQGLTCPN